MTICLKRKETFVPKALLRNRCFHHQLQDCKIVQALPFLQPGPQKNWLSPAPENHVSSCASHVQFSLHAVFQDTLTTTSMPSSTPQHFAVQPLIAWVWQKESWEFHIYHRSILGFGQKILMRTQWLFAEIEFWCCRQLPWLLRKNTDAFALQMHIPKGISRRYWIWRCFKQKALFIDIGFQVT